MKSQTVITLQKEISPQESELLREILNSPRLVEAMKKEVIKAYSAVLEFEVSEIGVEFGILEEESECCKN